jgi:hypothetical protein
MDVSCHVNIGDICITPPKGQFQTLDGVMMPTCASIVMLFMASSFVARYINDIRINNDKPEDCQVPDKEARNCSNCSDAWDARHISP